MIAVMKINNQFTTKFALLLLIQEGLVSPSVVGLKRPNADGGVLSDLHHMPINIHEGKKQYERNKN